MNNYDELLERAKAGKLSRDEIAQIATELEKPHKGSTLYTLLHIIGVTGDKSYRPLVERFLSFQKDPMIARLALQILCNFWGDTPQYRTKVFEFMRGVPWDQDEDIRLAAISIAGEYLRSYTDPKLLHDLICVFESESEKPIVRESAYLALARAVGKNWKELPSAARHFDLVRQTDPSIIATAKRWLHGPDHP